MVQSVLTFLYLFERKATMPIIGDTSTQPGTEVVKVPATNFTYSMTRLGDLEASEYTLVGIVSDVSGSVSGYKTDMEHALQSAIESCLKSPRADNLLIRHTMFDDKLMTNHDWKMLKYINPSDYQGSLQIGGLTALYDATDEMVKVMAHTGEQLTKGKFAANGIIFIITDGGDNASHATPTMIRTDLEKITQGEQMESVVTILIGVNASGGGGLASVLQQFQKDAGLTHYLELADASKSSLAKLAAFVSKSISSQSQALGSGGASKQLTSQNLTI
jgi:uncharacterized protein YegL